MSCMTLLMTVVLAATPEAWPGFLGQGATPVDPSTIPLTWSPTENIAWTAKLPGKGQSSPVIWGDKVFVTAIDGTMKDRCHVVALNLADGVVTWQKTFDAAQKVRSNYFQSRSAPTPVVDERTVYAFFETGNLIALSHEGETLWQRSLTEDYGSFESTIGLAASPLQTSDSVVLLIDHEGPSYLVAVDKKTGEPCWKTDRDSRVSYASPALVPVGDTWQIVCSSAGSVDGYDPKTGQLLWSYSENVGGNRSATPLPFGNGRFVIAASPGMHNENESEARKSNGVMSLERTADGFAAKVLWRTEEAMPAFNSPTVYRGSAYWVNRAGVVFCFDAETGEKRFVKRIGQGCWSTPVGIGERLYIFGKDGLTTVLKAGPEFELLAENQLWDSEKLGAESFARKRASGGDSVGHREHGPAAGKPAAGAGPQSDGASGTPAADRGATGSDPKRGDAAARSPAKTETEEASQRAQGGGRPAMTPEEEKRAREQGDNRFADPVQYGVAIVNGSLVIRTGEAVYCVRQQSAK